MNLGKTSSNLSKERRSNLSGKAEVPAFLDVPLFSVRAVYAAFFCGLFHCFSKGEVYTIAQNKPNNELHIQMRGKHPRHEYKKEASNSKAIGQPPH